MFQFRIEVGKASQKFIKTRWSPEEVAKRYLKIINNDIPSHWLAGPNDIKNIYGTLDCELSRQIVKRMIDEYGIDSLQLSHNPQLERAFNKFSGCNVL